MRQYSGWQLAVGDGAESGYNGNPIVALLFLAVLMVLLFLVLSLRRSSLTFRDTYGIVGTSVGVLLLLFQQFLMTPPEGTNREILYGLWGFIVGWVLILIGGVINTVERNSRKGAG